MNEKKVIPGWKIEVTNGSNKIDLYCPYGDLEHIVHCVLENGNACAVSKSSIESSVEVSASSDFDFSNFGLKPIEP